MARILVNTPATLTAVFYVGETATDPTPAEATVTITDAAGTALVTDAEATRASAGTFTYALAAQDDPALLTAVWTGGDGRKVTTRHEVVGGFYADLADIRSLDGLDSLANYPTAVLELKRQEAEDLVEDITGVSWVRRYALESRAGNGRQELRLDRMMPREVLSASIDGSAVTPLSQFKLYDHGRVRRDGDVFPCPEDESRNVVLGYVHGYDAPPADIRLAFLRLVRHLALGTNTRIDDRATSITTEMGTMSFTTAGTKRPTGLPEVDAVLMRHSHQWPKVG